MTNFTLLITVNRCNPHLLGVLSLDTRSTHIYIPLLLCVFFLALLTIILTSPTQFLPALGNSSKRKWNLDLGYGGRRGVAKNARSNNDSSTDSMETVTGKIIMMCI